MANKGLSIPQTKGYFQLRGIVLGTSRDKFYTEKKTASNKPFRSVNFGVRVDKNTVVYVEFNGMEQESVYFTGRDKGASKDAKNTTITVPFKDRFTYRKEGYRLIGLNVGLEKTLDEKQQEVNDKRNLHPFDATKYVSEHLKDGMSVFIKGSVEYGHYTNSAGNTVNTVKYVPTQISLCKPVVFDVAEGSEPYKVESSFSQPLVVEEIEKQEDGNFLLRGKVVTYNSIENAEFLVENPKLATNIRKLHAYTKLDMWGEIRTVANTDVVEEDSDDGWGDKNPMNRINTPYRTIRVITGADPKTMDDETYTQEKMAEALKEVAKKESKSRAFETASDDWGDKPTEDDDKPWD